MKKLILSFGIFLAAFFAVNAQSRMDVKATKMVDKINRVCGLTPDQAARLQTVATQYLKTRHANLQQYGNNPDEMKQADKTANQNYKAQLKSILTPEQAQKMKAYREEQKAKRQTGNGQKGEDDSQPEQQ